MKKSIFALLITGILFIFASSGYATDYVDYSDELAELETLLDKCEAMGISTDYEMVNYTTVKRFEDYINEDIDNNMNNVEYNIKCMDNLYSEAKSNLEAYLNGTKIPFTLKRPDMSNLSVKGSALYDRNTPVFSIGYGHFETAQKDVPHFQNFGTSNIQIEVGPTKLLNSFAGWTENSYNNVYAGFEKDTVKNSGKYSLKVINNTSIEDNRFATLKQEVPCNPGTTYSFGCSSLGSDIKGLTISANDYANRYTIQPSDSWVENKSTYTTGEEQTTLVFRVISADVTSAWLDDFFLYELDSQGKIVSGNLLENPGFEQDDYKEAVKYITDSLEDAEESNIGVTLLLSPHYFPTYLHEELYTQTTDFLKYNVDAEETKEIIEKYLRTLMPLVVDYPALQSICLSNEPNFNTMNFPEYFNPKFREYLEGVHGDIQTLNRAYGGTGYKSFDEVCMPDSLTDHSSICYDWIEFNDTVFAEWHEWMAGIVKEYTNVPVHAKTTIYVGDAGDNDQRTQLTRGTDIEMFAKFCDYAGNDAWDYSANPSNYYKTMFYYDYLLSVTGDPVYNSEDHIIADREENYNLKERMHIRNNLLMGAIHGRSMSSIWTWERSYAKTSDFYGSVLFRPDVIAEIGKTNLDLTRLASEVNLLQQTQPRVALYYSKTSRLYDNEHMESVMRIYKNLLNRGIKVGIISDKSINQLGKYDCVILPNVANGSAEAYKALCSYQGNIIYTGNPFGADEYNQPTYNSILLDKAYKLTDYNIFNTLEITEVDMLGENGDLPEEIDWQYVITDNRILICATNLEYNTEKTVSLYRNGELLDGYKNLITADDISGEIVLRGYEPQILEYRLPAPSEITNLSADNYVLSWEASNENYTGANIYKVDSLGDLVFITQTDFYSYNAEQAGTYVVKAINEKMESNGEIITVGENNNLINVQCDVKAVGENGVTLVIKAVNNNYGYVSGVVACKFTDETGKTVNYVTNKISLFRKQPKEYTLFLSHRGANNIEIYTVDSEISENIISNIINISL